MCAKMEVANLLHRSSAAKKCWICGNETVSPFRLPDEPECPHCVCSFECLRRAIPQWIEVKLGLKELDRKCDGVKTRSDAANEKFSAYVAKCEKDVTTAAFCPQFISSPVLKVSYQARISAMKAIGKELNILHAKPVDYINVTSSVDNVQVWRVLITIDAQKHNDPVECYIYFPDVFPFKPPNIRIVRRVEHSYVNSDGFISLPLTTVFHWTPSIGMRAVLENLRDFVHVYMYQPVPEPRIPIDCGKVDDNVIAPPPIVQSSLEEVESLKPISVKKARLLDPHDK